MDYVSFELDARLDVNFIYMYPPNNEDFIIKSCSSNVVFCRVGNDLCSSGRMVATFMPMFYVAMNFDPVPNKITSYCYNLVPMANGLL